MKQRVLSHVTSSWSEPPGGARPRLGCITPVNAPRAQVRMSNNLAKIAEARKDVEQLKMEVDIERMKVSVVVSDMLSFCQSHCLSDPLVSPVPSVENPFRDKRLVCAVL
ncbi:guanine nucleotide-binding protein G(I)/G(S)/G(O) subunit gamma-8-like isoform X5 [Bufo bufo]|uniref:guanine nucleotide-binding protein G(I)/G(S)/G(O) subunit gamma-8-like isoform X5 n=2 Tax=Bufo bufo TaxID=8384 RepID=UPI001ABE71B2|nr:guanine nucleotide-binding protein G(I)/G(S)/G(O) subunit gamma-8-like isoform X5 [Bufo bufo]